MSTQITPIFDKLYALAEGQQGYFAASQAKQLGYSRQLQSYYVSTGEWVRKARGIFRLKYFPPAPLPDGFYVTYLWALDRNGQPEGVFGYGTALYLHKLSTYVPPVLDLVVPKHFRRHSEPPGQTELRKHKIDKSDYQIISGLPITKPLRTIIDLLDSKSIDYDYVLDGLKTALEQFSITLKQMRQANLTVAQSDRLKLALERIGYDRRDEIR